MDEPHDVYDRFNMSAIVYPKATLRPVPSHGDTMTGPILGLCVHVTTGEDVSPYNEFINPDNQASSTWWVSDEGAWEQYMPSADLRAWAQAAGNDTYMSVETAGDVNTPLTAAQIDAIAELYVWGNKLWGWALQTANVPGEKGLIYHAAGGEAWGGHPCPGPIRIAQLPSIITKAKSLIIPPIPTNFGQRIVAGMTWTPTNGAGYWLIYRGKRAGVPSPPDLNILKVQGVPKKQLSAAQIGALVVVPWGKL